MPTLDSVVVVDWNRSNRAEFSHVPSNTTVGDLLDEARGALALAPETPWDLILGDEKLARGMTLGEAGVRTGTELTAAPTVSAGLGACG